MLPLLTTRDEAEERRVGRPEAPRSNISACPVLIETRNLFHFFDVSSPWIDRLVNREARQLLMAVDNVSFAIRRGQTFGLVGESGSGKTTLAKIMVGLLQPTSGQILFRGHHNMSPATPHGSLRRRLAMVFQDPHSSLDPRMTTNAIVAEPIIAFRLADSRAERARRVDQLLGKVGLSVAHGAKYPHQLSGGERQRVAIARALAAEPDFIVFDEATSALDVSVQAQVLNLMLDLQEEFGFTYLVISHSLSVIRFVATAVGVMYLGRLVEIADAETLFGHPRHPYTQMLIASVPVVSRSVRRKVAPPRAEIANPLNPPAGCAFHPRCPLAIDRCRVQVPELRTFGASQVACHLA